SFESDKLERDSDDQESSSSEDTHLDELKRRNDQDLICCDGCENAYHADCLVVDANALHDIWYGPCCEKRLPTKRQSADSSAHNGAKSKTEKIQDDDRVKGR
ncbi:hypothetical protein ACHAW6_004363, partial [Cyclotella cf. meneghiniana]